MIEIYIKKNTNYPKQVGPFYYEEIGPKWTGTQIKLPFGLDGLVLPVIGWSDNGRTTVSVQYVSWNGHRSYLVYGGNCGLRVLNENEPQADDNLPKGFGMASISITFEPALPAEVLEVVKVKEKIFSERTLGLFPFVIKESIEESLDWVIVGHSLRDKLKNHIWSNLTEEIYESGISYEQEKAVEDAMDTRFMTKIQVVDNKFFEVTIYDKEAQPDSFRQQMLATLQDLEDEGLVEHNDEEEHLIDEP